MTDLSEEDFARICEESKSWEREQKGGAVLFEVDRNGNAIQVGWCHALGCVTGPDSPITSPYKWVPGTFALTDSGALWRVEDGEARTYWRFQARPYWRFVGGTVE